jgi:hypothetical protein
VNKPGEACPESLNLSVKELPAKLLDTANDATRVNTKRILPFIKKDFTVH